MNERSYLIHELAEKTGVSVRTIRFYVEKGLLPEAPIKGRYAAYSEEYIERIELIKWLKQLHLPLDKIRNHIAHLSRQGVQRYLKQRDLQQARMKSMQAQLPGMEGVDDLLKEIENVLNREQELPDQRTNPQEALLGGVVWERLEIAEGIELHFRRPLDPRQQRKIQALIEYAYKQFGEQKQQIEQGGRHGSSQPYSIR